MRHITGWILLIIMIVLVSLSFADPAQTTKAKANGPSINNPAGKTTQQQPMTDIFDITPPQAIGFDKTVLYWIGGIVIALLLLLIAFFLMDKWLRNRRNKDKAAPPVYTPPDIEAHNALTMLAGRQTLEDRLFYFELTAILKRYLERQFAVDAMEKTTEELLPMIRKLSFNKSLIEGIKALLTGSDPIKYARFSVDQSQRKADLAFVQTLVDQTKPRPETQDGTNRKNG